MSQIDSVVWQLQAERKQLVERLSRIDDALRLLRGPHNRIRKAELVGFSQSKDRSGSTRSLGKGQGTEGRFHQCAQTHDVASRPEEDRRSTESALGEIA